MAPLRCLLASALLLLAPSVSLAQSDTTAPSLIEFDFSPQSVDVSVAAQLVALTARATDDLSGPNRLEIRFTSPSGIHSASGTLARSGPVNTTLDATFAGTVGILPNGEPGTWLVQVTAFDNSGNSLLLTASDLAARGFPSTLEVISTGAVDTTPPAIVEFGFTPTDPDVSVEARAITVTARATDDLSGPDTLEVTFTSPSGDYSHTAPLFRSGPVNTPLDATFGGVVTLPRFAEPGRWRAELRAWDRLRNAVVLDAAALASRGLPSELDVTSATPPDSDTTPPALTEFSFSPTSVDVTGAPQAVTISARVTDDLSGIGSVSVRFRSPSGRQSHYAYLSRSGPVNSTLDATLSGTLTIPQFVESGTWTADVSLWDSVGNSAFLAAGNLDALGFPTTLAVDSNEDTTPPQVQSAVVSPPLIDVSSADQSISIDVRITDDLSGFDSSGSQQWSLGYLASPSAYRYVIPLRAATQVSGDPLDSLWRVEWTIPQYSEAGTWVLYVSASDTAGNSAWHTAGTFEVAATTQDLAAPVLTGLRFSPAVINTSRGPATVRVSLDLTDDLSGVHMSLDSPYGGYFHGLFFSSPSSGQSRSASGFTLSAGTVMDGTWEADAYFPQFSESGTWSATVAQASDRVHNFLSLSPQQLAALGLTSELVVVRPSLVGDGSVDTGGGTVEDDTFGNRASLTFPPGVVGSSTAVAIDVFPDPLAVPTPTGFQGPGTHFVNISLTPEPVYPFAPPGVTATLPLPDFVNPGTALPLFFVNETSGTLEPMPDATTGLQVVGTVNADGLSATFTGISHFSILVGMTPDVVHVDIDIRPKSFPNRVSTLGAGTIPVAVLSTATFDAPATVDPASLTFGRVGDEASLSLCKGNADINGDGLIDLVCHFDQQATGFGPGDTLGILRGRTWAGENLVGSDSVRVVQ